jgi:hypothetical protein
MRAAGKLLDLFGTGWEANLPKILDAISHRAISSENFSFLADCGLFGFLARSVHSASTAEVSTGILKVIATVEDLSISFGYACPTGLHDYPFGYLLAWQRFGTCEPWKLLAKAAGCSRFHPAAAEILIRGILGKQAGDGPLECARAERSTLSVVLQADATAKCLVDAPQVQRLQSPKRNSKR